MRDYMSKKYHILLLEDNAADAELIINELKKQKFLFYIKQVASKKSFINKLWTKYIVFTVIALMLEIK